MALRVFLVDDHEIVRSGLRSMLEAEGDIEVVGEAGTAAEATTRGVALGPDVAVLDVRLPDGDGIEVCRELRSRLPEAPVPDVDLVRRRRGSLCRHHGRSVRLRAQADPRHRPRRRRASSRAGRVAHRPFDDKAGLRPPPRRADARRTARHGSRTRNTASSTSSPRV